MLKETKQLETNKYELTAAVDAEAFEAAVQKAFLKNRKRIDVPGFRKGKAPRKIVERMYGEGLFYEDAVNDLYPDTVNEAVKESGLTVVAPPSVDVKEISKENGVTFTITVVTKPEVTLEGYKGMEVEKEVKPVTDEDVQKRMEAMQHGHGRQIDVDDRATQKGDTVTFDFDGSVDGVPFEGGKAENYTLTLGSGQFIPGFEDQMEGKNIGEEFDVNVTFPEDYHAEELKGKAAVFKCKISAIRYTEYPALDDEFAKDVSEFDTLDELKADEKRKMEEANQKDADTQVENKLVDMLIEKMQADIPEEMIDVRVDEKVREFEYRLTSQGMSLELYQQYTGTTEDGLKKTFREQAEKEVKVRLALEKIVELENIQPTEEDMNAEYEKLAKAYQLEVDKVKEMLPAETLKEDVAVNLAIDLVKNSAVVTEK